MLGQLPPEVVDQSESHRELLSELGSVGARAAVFETLTRAQYDLLAVAAEIAQPEPGGPRAHHRSVFFHPFGLSEPHWLDPEDLLARVDHHERASGTAAREALNGLLDRALLWPSEFGHHHLALGVDTAFGTPEGHAPAVNDALSRAYELPELRRIALALGLDPTKKRRALQAEVVARLTDPEQVRALLKQAPRGAVELVERLTFEGGLLGTYCFQNDDSNPTGSFRFRPDGAGDTDTDWLAEHGLLVPLAPERALLPREVAEAVRASSAPPLSLTPPEPVGRAVDQEAVHAQAQAALLEALAAVDRLVAEVAERPAALRKSGGMTVRDRKRLAKVLGTDPDRTRLWIETAYAAGLLMSDGPQVTVSARAGAWARSESADRTVSLLVAWWNLPDAPTWWPDGEDPVIPAGAFLSGAVALRQGLLLSMADLPPGQGVGVTSRALSDAAGQGDSLTELGGVLETALWYRPAAQAVDEAGPLLWHTLYEAELLGLFAHGALTGLGRAVATGGTGQALREAASALLPPVEECARFQGDMTAVVTGTPSARLESLLNTVAERESDGYASTWRLSPTSVRRALDAGHPAEELLGDLAGVSADGNLPQTVDYLIRDTARGHGRMSVLPAACCVRSADPALVREMAQNRGLKALRLRAVADTVLVSAKPVRATLEALRRQGYAPVAEDESGGTVVGRVPGAAPAGSDDASLALVPGSDQLVLLARSLSGS
ncbi:helicase-associated domain-containing protein [Nocardiopsis exhalans]